MSTLVEDYRLRWNIEGADYRYRPMLPWHRDELLRLMAPVAPGVIAACNELAEERNANMALAICRLPDDDANRIHDLCMDGVSRRYLGSWVKIHVERSKFRFDDIHTWVALKLFYNAMVLEINGIGRGA